MKILVLLIILLNTNGIIQGQVDESKLGSWLMLFISKPSESKLEIEADFQYRSWSIGNDIQQLIARAGLVYKFKPKNLRLAAGYGYFRGEDYGESSFSVTENRLHQDVLYKNKISHSAFLQYRLRMEERWIENFDFTARIRLQIAANFPITNEEMKANTLYANISNEVFFNLIRNIGSIKFETFDRNWTFIGLGFQFEKKRSLQFGIMHETNNNWNKNQLQFIYHHFL